VVPLFAEPVPVGTPNVGSRAAFDAHVDQIFATRRLSNGGPLVQRFERRIAEHVGVRHAVAVVNATVGLEITARALGLHGEVVVPSYTFVATAHALSWLGITPVFADVDERTHLLDPEAVRRALTPRTTGIVGVHLWGRPAPVTQLRQVADDHGLQLLFDAAHAFGVSHRGRMVGSFGRAEVFSFHATKFVNSFEGGAVVTDDDELADQLRRLRAFGFRDTDDVAGPGTNGKMPEICAAMGLVNLDAMPDVVAANRAVHAAYAQALADVPHTRLHHPPAGERANYQYVVLEVDDGRPGARDRVLAALHAHNVMARRYFWPGCHRQEPYRTLAPDAGRLLPRTEAVAERVLVLPTGSVMTPVRARVVAGIVAAALDRRRATTVPRQVGR
jgi:dTDP-4-amino-4,6-dideoxygalactose transaminase